MERFFEEVGPFVYCSLDLDAYFYCIFFWLCFSWLNCYSKAVSFEFYFFNSAISSFVSSLPLLYYLTFSIFVGVIPFFLLAV